MTTVTLPIGASDDTLKRCIYLQVPDIDPAIFDRVPRGDAAGVVRELIEGRPDVKVEWD